MEIEMPVVSHPLPHSLLVMPNAEYFFGDVGSGLDWLDVVERCRFENVAEIFLVRAGALGFRFLDDGPLASLEVLDISGTGAIPDYVTARRDEVVALQGRRLLFANFVAAAIFGRAAAHNHTSLIGALNVGMNDILVFAIAGDRLRVERSPYTETIIGRKIASATRQAGRVRALTSTDLAEAMQFLGHVSERGATFDYANLQVCMAMNYQAAILHSAQHAPASLALNFSVAEALVKEIFFSYGLVGGAQQKPFANRIHTVEHASSNQFNRLSVAQKLSRLVAGGLIDQYLFSRLEEARILRNDLMHGAIPVAVPQSGTLQTAVRDLWAILLDAPFELTAGYTMRI